MVFIHCALYNHFMGSTVLPNTTLCLSFPLKIFDPDKALVSLPLLGVLIHVVPYFLVIRCISLISAYSLISTC